MIQEHLCSCYKVINSLDERLNLAGASIRICPSYAEDAFAGVTWLIAQASNLGVDTHRIAIMGDSGGGGVAAGAAIVARERQFALARQILIYPMLDDRNSVPNALLTPFAIWTYDQNYTAWNAVLDGKQGSDTVSLIAAPARSANREFTSPAPAECWD